MARPSCALLAASLCLLLPGRTPAQDDAGYRAAAGMLHRGLFDLAADPNEKTNLASTNPEKVAELRARLDTYAAEAVTPKSAPMAAGFKTPRVWGQKD